MDGTEDGDEMDNDIAGRRPQGKAWKPWAVGLWLEDAELVVKEGIKWKN